MCTSERVVCVRAHHRARPACAPAAQRPRRVVLHSAMCLVGVCGNGLVQMCVECVHGAIVVCVNSHTCDPSLAQLSPFSLTAISRRRMGVCVCALALLSASGSHSCTERLGYLPSQRVEHRPRGKDDGPVPEKSIAKRVCMCVCGATMVFFCCCVNVTLMSKDFRYGQQNIPTTQT
jgi:hypothetical protein